MKINEDESLLEIANKKRKKHGSDEMARKRNKKSDKAEERRYTRISEEASNEVILNPLIKNLLSTLSKVCILYLNQGSKYRYRDLYRGSEIRVRLVRNLSRRYSVRNRETGEI